MKKILFILSLLISVCSFGQVKQKYNQYGGRWLRSKDSLATQIPLVQIGIKDFNNGFDTGQIYYKKTDSSIYVHTGFQWIKSGEGQTQAKGLFVEFPSSSEQVGMWMTPANITITAVKAVLVGSSTPSVTYDLKHGSDITSGTAILSAPVAITTTTTPTSSTSFSDATVPAGNYIWFYTTAQSGSVTSIWITVYYTID